VLNLFFYLFCLITTFSTFAVVATTYGQQILPSTEIVADPVDSIGSKSATRPVQVLEKKLLNSDGRPHFSDALNTIPGVQARLDGSPLISIRGSQSASRVLVIQDGVPLNFSDGVGYNPIFIARENLESVSLLEGPASSLFGRDALAGAIEFRSEKLSQPKFRLSQGSFNTNQVFAGTPIFKSENISAQVTAFETHSDGTYSYKIPRTGGTATRVRNDTETLRSTLSAQGRGDSIKWTTFHLIARQIGSTPDSIYSVYPASFNNWGELSFLGAELNLTDHLAFAERTSYKTLTQTAPLNLNSLTTSFRQGVSTILKIGEANVEVFDDVSFENFQASYYSNTQAVTINEYGAKALLMTENKISVQPAVRASSENGAFSPSLGFSGFNEEEWKIFLNYSEGYSPVSVTQKYSLTPGFTGNSNLQAEHSEEVDMGFEKTIHEYFLHFEAFGRDMQNLIQNVATSSTNLTPQNVGRARAYGFEFQGKRDGFINLGANLSYLQNRKIDVDAPVLLSPSVQASLFVEKVFGDYSVILQDTQWSSYYDVNFSTNQQVQLDGWNTLDFFIKFGLIKGWHGELALLNVLDQPRELNFGYPEPQSSFTFSLVGYL
jgi:outer membrane cobalamin receptor